MCPVCHKAGLDGHPLLRRSEATDPKPESKPEARPEKPKTRKERRRLLQEAVARYKGKKSA